MRSEPQGAGPDLVLPGDALGVAADGGPVLRGGRCRSCGTGMFPRPPVCPGCMGEDIASEDMPREGVLYSFTVLHVGARRWAKPSGLGYVDLPNGVRVFTHLTGLDRLACDAPVTLSTAAVGTEADGRPIKTFVFAPSSSGAVERSGA